jgi:hypothetical protein
MSLMANAAEDAVFTFTSRAERRSIFSLNFFGNPLLIFTVVAAQALHI